jgi:hypothetical protein
MKLPDAIAEKLRLAKDNPIGSTDLKWGIPIVKDGKFTIEYFYRNSSIGSVSFDNTAEARSDFLRTIAQGQNPDTDAGASK